MRPMLRGRGSRGMFRGGRGGMGMGPGPMGPGPNMGPPGMGPRPLMRPPGPMLNMPHASFDLAMCEPTFPRATPEPDDKPLQEALLRRNGDLTPAAAEQAALLNLVTRAQAALEALAGATGAIKLEGVTLEEVRATGAYKQGTMVTGHNVADVVVIFKTLPTPEAVSALGKRVLDDMKELESGKALSLVIQPTGFEIHATDAVVNVLVATTPPNLQRLEEGTHLNRKLLAAHLASIRHSRWFEENAFHSSVKVLIRLLSDVCRRFEGLSHLTPWMLELLSHYAIMQGPAGAQAPLPVHAGFRRVFRLLAAGFFLPGSRGVTDPCEPGGVCVHTLLSPTQQDAVCYTAQTLLRVLQHGGFKQVLGLEGNASIATEMSVWEGVVVTPSDKAYEPTADGNQQDMEIE